MSRPRALDRPTSVADLVEAVHAGTIGHAEAMRRLNLNSYAELLDTVHMHGLTMWAHRPVRAVPAATLDVLAAACGQPRQAPGDEL